MERGIEFFTLVQNAIVRRGRLRDHVDDTLKVACNLPEGMTIEEIAGAFVRWYYGDPPDTHDGPVLSILEGRTKPKR